VELKQLQKANREMTVAHESLKSDLESKVGLTSEVEAKVAEAEAVSKQQIEELEQKVVAMTVKLESQVELEQKLSTLVRLAAAAAAAGL